MLMRRRAFTIVELLVTVGVIALLLALLIPGLGRVSASGRSVECMSNLKQMATAAQAYGLEYNAYPTALRYENPGVFTTIAWDWVQTIDGELISPGPLWMFTDNPASVQQCPDYHGDSSFGVDPFTGYNYNTTYLGGEARFPMTGWGAVREGIAPSLCRRGSLCALFGDGGWSGGTNKFMRAPLNREGYSLSEIYAGGQSFRHLGATNVAYVDGHVASVSMAQEGEYATEELLSQFMDYPVCGFLSNDDSAYRPR